MAGTVQKIVECVRDGKVIARYSFGYGVALAPTPPPDLVAEAKEMLVNDGLIKLPFDFRGVEFHILDAQ